MSLTSSVHIHTYAHTRHALASPALCETRLGAGRTAAIPPPPPRPPNAAPAGERLYVLLSIRRRLSETRDAPSHPFLFFEISFLTHRLLLPPQHCGGAPRRTPFSSFMTGEVGGMAADLAADAPGGGGAPPVEELEDVRWWPRSWVRDRLDAGGEGGGGTSRASRRLRGSWWWAGSPRPRGSSVVLTNTKKKNVKQKIAGQAKAAHTQDRAAQGLQGASKQAVRRHGTRRRRESALWNKPPHTRTLTSTHGPWPCQQLGAAQYAGRHSAVRHVQDLKARKKKNARTHTGTHIHRRQPCGKSTEARGLPDEWNQQQKHQARPRNY